MYRDHKIIVGVPSGRREFLSNLVKYFHNNHVIDEVHMWVNTNNKKDLDFINNLCGEELFTKVECPNKIETRPNQTYTHLAVSEFYQLCVDPKTIYFKVDDDICYIEPGTFEALADFVLDTDCCVVFPTIINNSICTNVLQKLGKLPTSQGKAGYKFNCPIGWGSSEFAHWLHNEFLSNIKNIDQYKFDSWILGEERFSINFFAWIGSRMKSMLPVAQDDEIWMSSKSPKYVCGKKIVSHFSFGIQHQKLKSTNIMKRYHNLNMKIM